MADEKVKQVIKGVVDAVALVMDVQKGAGIFVEIKDAYVVFRDVLAELKDAPQLLPEYLNLSDADRKDLEDYIAKNVVLPGNINIQTVLQDVLNVIVSLSQIAGAFKPKEA